MLGFNRSGIYLGQLYGKGTGQIWLDDLQCSGSEMSLENCAHSGWGDHNCDHYEDVSITCGNEIESARLVGGNGNPRAGRLEVNYYGVWGTVCSDNFDYNDVKVACYMLGFKRSGVYLGQLFGEGAGQIWLDNLQCSGSEMSLDNCTHRGWGVHNCDHSEDVSILCSDEIESVRLVGGNGNPRLGRLEISYGGVWGTVCSNNFDNNDAKVACYMLGFERSGVYISNKYGVGTGQIWLDDLQCNGSEMSFDNCTHRGWGVHNCDHYQDVAITCGDDSDRLQTTEQTTMNYKATTLQSDGGVTSVPFRPITVDSVRPLYGPVAGGTRVTITGQLVSVTIVTAVYFGKYKLYPDTDSTAENAVYVTTQPVNETARHLPIKLLLYDRSSIYTNRTFEYRSNPVLTDIRPRDHLTVGGTEVTVHGRHLDSVAEPRITVTVIITNFYTGINKTSATNHSNAELCRVPQRNANGSMLLCRMPALNLPDHFTEQLKHSESGTIDNIEGPGVAVYWSSNRSVRADIYVGLKLDGVTLYQNISSVNANIKMQFARRPVVSCKSDVVDFDPHNDKVISIEGRHMQRGSRLVDFTIKFGDAVCVPESLTDNRVVCRPPTERPNRNINDTFCQGDMLSLQMMIGNAEYQCWCVRYTSQVNTAMIVSLSVGLGLLLVVLLLIAIDVALYRGRHSRQVRQKNSGSKDNISMEQVKEDTLHTINLSDDDVGDTQGMSGYVNISKDKDKDKEDKHHFINLTDDVGDSQGMSGYLNVSKEKDKDKEDEHYTTHLSDDVVEDSQGMSGYVNVSKEKHRDKEDKQHTTHLTDDVGEDSQSMSGYANMSMDQDKEDEHHATR